MISADLFGVTEITDARWTPSSPDSNEPIVDLEHDVIVKPIGKNRRPRVIHLDPTAKKLLSRIARDKGPVFPALAGRRSNRFPHVWHALRDEAELEGFQMRDLRRSFATEMNNTSATTKSPATMSNGTSTVRTFLT